MVKTAIAAEEEYKNTLYAEVDVRAPAHTQNHTSMPERNHIDDHSFHGHVTSKPVLDGFLPVHPPSFLVLRECGQGRVILPLVVGHSSQAALTDKPATLRASTLMMRKYSEIAMRPSTDVVISTKAPAAHVLSSGPPAPASDRTLALATALPPWLVGRKEPTREESPEEVLCPTDHRLTPLGHPGGTGNRLREQGLGRLLTILPWYPLAPNLACTNEAAPRGESPDGHTAEIPHGHTAETPDSYQ